jgi:hypothetical protein
MEARVTGAAAAQASEEEWDESADLVSAAEGHGPLLERDYWVVIQGGHCTPEQAMQRVLAEFPRFSPGELAQFTHPSGGKAPLAVGDVMDIDITGDGKSQVQITRIDARRLTMQTVEGHPEAGRITFGAYLHQDGHLIFRIRSRARLRDRFRLIGYRLLGRAMQTRVWITFCQRVAEECGGRIIGEVQTETREVREELSDRGIAEQPTFTADGAG